MKKIIYLGMIVCLNSHPLKSCNICGNATGGNYLGVLPQYQKHYFGLRYHYRSFQTEHMPSLNPDLSGKKSMEQFQTLELNGRYCPGKRWQFLGVFNLQKLEQTSGETRNLTAGFGDPAVLGYYSVINGKIRERKKYRHLLQIGAGLKFPLGVHSDVNDAGVYSPAFQLGSGSLDYLFSAVYTLRGFKAGVVTDATYLFNGTNRLLYKFGNRLMASARYFRTYSTGKNTLMINSGLYCEYNQSDMYKNLFQRYTGGTLVMPFTGVDFYSKHWACGLNVRIPLFDNSAEGYIQSRARYNLNLTYLF